MAFRPHVLITPLIVVAGAALDIAHFLGVVEPALVHYIYTY